MRLSGSPPVFVGVVHLPPLPGSVRPSPGLASVLERALHDTRALLAGGADAVIVENFGDAPFEADDVAPYTVAAMTRAVHEVVGAAGGMAVGVNILRNDARAALSVAAATGASFIRVNVHVGAMVTDQGVLEGSARRTLLERKRLDADVRIVADVLVKHAVPLGPWSLEDAARDTASRGLADVLVVTGRGTGLPADPDALRRVRGATPGKAVWIGSGLTPENAEAFAGLDGAIVGTWLHQEGDVTRPLDPDRVRRMRAALSG